MGMACSTNGEKRTAYRRLVGKISLGRPRRMWLVNIKIDLRGIGWCDMDWIFLAQDGNQWRDFVNTAMNLRVQSNFGKVLSSCVFGGFS
jgi:hypothetical protein